jgi:hypothetical protein
MGLGKYHSTVQVMQAVHAVTPGGRSAPHARERPQSRKVHSPMKSMTLSMVGQSKSLKSHRQESRRLEEVATTRATVL